MTEIPTTFYTKSPFSYHRRESREVYVGDVAMGGNNPIRIQSMTNTNTLDTEACVQQILRMVAAGSEYVRITTPRKEEAANLYHIKKRLNELHCRVPLIADVHFTPDVAEVAAEIVEKVRINPGNYTDRKIITHYSEQAYREAMERTAERLVPLLKICQRNGTAIRIGTNHGSLSPRIVDRYGDTALGMAVSAMEFIAICEDFGFHNLVLSMKASNVRVMTESVRILVALMDQKGWNYPLHLGVTEAGNGSYGRIKSTAGILPLLYDGIGDTIRVSLTEAPENELPTARILADLAEEGPSSNISAVQEIAYAPYHYHRRESGKGLAGKAKCVVITSCKGKKAEDMQEEETLAFPRVRPTDEVFHGTEGIVLETKEGESVLESRYFFNRLLREGKNMPVILHRIYAETDWERFCARATADFAFLLSEGWGDGIWISNPHFDSDRNYQLSLQILQACGIRYDKAEYIACPSCGRTQYRIEEALEAIRKRTSHLNNLKIGVMGCIVNGPGEMADADYGFVGCGNGKVSLYKGQTPVYHQVPQEEGIDMLIRLIKENGDWKEP